MFKILHGIFSFAFSFLFLGVVAFLAYTDHYEGNRTKSPIAISVQKNTAPSFTAPIEDYNQSATAADLDPITVTNSTFPVVGDTLKTACDYNPPGAIIAIFTPPGGDQMWDLSNLQVESSQNIVFHPPSDGMATASAPGAELVTFGSPHPEEYFNVTPSVMETMGYFDKNMGFWGGSELAANNFFNYSPPLAERHAPLNFFDVYQSTCNSLEAFAPSALDPSFSAILLNLEPLLDSMRFRETRQRIESVDAWGSMTIPEGTYDVLRVKRTEYRSRAIDIKVFPLGWIDISTIGGQQLFPLGTDTLTSFLYVNDQVKEYIAVADLNTAQNTVLKVTFRNGTPLNPPTCNPTISCKDQVTPVQCSNQVNFIEAMAFNSCDTAQSIPVTAKNDTIVGGCANNFAILRTWTATDLSGKSSSCSRMIVVNDTIPPVISCKPVDTVECVKDIPACSPNGLASSSDNCDNQLSISCSDAPLAMGCNVSFVRTYMARDDCDNVGTCNVTITVANNMPSSITCPKNDTVRSCDEVEIAAVFDIWLHSVMASGGCNSMITNDNDGPPPVTGGTKIVTFRNISACDTASCQASFTVLPLTSTITLSGPDTTCEGDGTPLIVNIKITGGTAPYTITFGHTRTYLGPNCDPLASGPAGIVLDQDGMYTVAFTGAGAGHYIFQVSNVTDVLECVDDSVKTLAFDIIPLPEGKDSTKTIENCSDGITTDLQGLIKCNLPSTFSWYSVASVGSAVPYDNPNVIGETINPPNTSQIINDVLTNITQVNQTVVYRVEPTSIAGSCEGSPFYITIIIKPSIINLVAQDQLNISLDESCMKVLTAADVIQNSGSCTEILVDINLVYPFGTNTYPEGDKLDRSHVGYCMVYSVTDLLTGNKSWGKLCVEDKAPPGLNCADDTVSCFEFADLPLLAEPANDCSGDQVKLLGEKWVDYGCDSTYLGYVDRTIWGSDRWQNTRTCTSRIYIRKTSLEQVECPGALDFPCTITHQIGGVKELKTPISVDKTKLTPEFLLSLQKSIWEFKDGSKDKVFYSTLNAVPHVMGKSVYQATSGVCKINATYTDKPLAICGIGVKIRREWIIFDWCTQLEKTCIQYLSIDDIVPPIPTDKNLGIIVADPHDCGQYVNLPKLDYKDCNEVKQTYSLTIHEEGISRILQGDLPANHIWLPDGNFEISVRLVDECYNQSFGKILLSVEDQTPPTPVCVEYTQVTVEPEGCWAAIAARDLDQGSRDNCSSNLHFAAALMDSIDFWTNYWTSTLETSCGKDEFWKNKTLYDRWIQDWIDCYVFRDTVHFDDCGNSQVVLRVYEADRIPLRDPHLFDWPEHAWYCYNSNTLYRIAHNYNYFDSKGIKSASWRLPLDCKSSLEAWISSQKTKYISSRYGHNTPPRPNNSQLPMDSIRLHGVYCPGDTSINLKPGECNRIVKYAITLPSGYTAVQTSGLPSGTMFPIGTTVNGFNINNGNMLVTTCSFSVTIKEFDLFPAPVKPMVTIQSNNTYCPVDTTINLNPGECGRVVKYSILLPPGYSSVQTSGLPSGSEYPIGTTVNTFNINNGNVLVTNCSFFVKINEFATPSPNLYCNEKATIILDGNPVVIGGGQVLINANYGCFDNYIVELFKSAYVPAVVSLSDIGKEYTYRVTDPRTSNRCEGKIQVSAPSLNCKPMITIALNNNGFSVLGAGEVLIDADYRCFDNYIVEFLKGSYVPGVAGTQDIGMTLPYRVTDPVTGVRCSGKVLVDDLNHSIESLYFLSDRRKSNFLYNDCMVTVLVDDKQAPVVNHLNDITIYCDGAPDYAGYPECEHNERFSKWPLDLKDSKGLWHGYYGGSDFLGIHTDPADHSDPDACEYNKGWAPIYCRSWLYWDSTDAAGHINPAEYFDKLVLVDKKRPLDHTLKSNEFTITDNCRLDDATLTVVDNGTLNGCSEGWIQRTWTIKDKCGNAVTATQKIIVKHRSDFEVIFPEDKVVTCDFLNRTDTGHAGVPIISDDECEQIGVRYSDEIFTVEDSACYKIVRTWTLIDWCVYDPNNHTHYPDVIVDDRLRANNTNRSCVYRHIKDNNDGYMTYVQIIKVIDEIPPVVTTRDTTVCVYSDDCTVSVVIPLSASDNCAAASDIRFRYFIDLNATDAVYNGRLFDPTSIDQGGTQYVKDFVFLLGAPGRHVVHVVGIDNCGNADTSSFRFEIKDCKKPTPYCYNGIATVIMPSTGQVTVWAKDLNLNSSDNCTPAADLKYSFTSDVTTASKQFTCADLSSDGQNQIFEVEIWVTDKAGNQDLCKTYIKIQDNADAANGRPEGACKDTVASLASISGKLLTEDQQGVESATVQIKSATPSGIPAWKSSIDGSYQFNSIPTSGSYSISAMRDDNPMNGVSTLDLVLIQKHILGTERLTSPYKIIAADADNDQNVSAIDLIELRKLILGLYDKLPNNTSWKFVPMSYIFQDINNPWSAPNEEQITVAQGVMVKDFVGIKIGDVNATAAPHSLMGTEVRGSGSGLILEVKDRVFKSGEQVEVSFTSPNFKGISGFQGTLMNSKLRFEGVKSKDGILSLNNQNFGTRWASEGLTTISWNTISSVDLDDKEILFTLVFTALSPGSLSEVLRVSSQKTLAESYEGKGEMGNLSIRFVGQNGQEVTTQSALYQNYPNPFDSRTVIGIDLAEQGRGTFKVTDITGRTIKVIEKEWNKGYNEVWLDRREIKATGVLYYSFEGGTLRATKKMIMKE